MLVGEISDSKQQNCGEKHSEAGWQGHIPTLNRLPLRHGLAIGFRGQRSKVQPQAHPARGSAERCYGTRFDGAGTSRPADPGSLPEYRRSDGSQGPRRSSRVALNRPADRRVMVPAFLCRTIRLSVQSATRSRSSLQQTIRLQDPSPNIRGLRPFGANPCGPRSAAKQFGERRGSVGCALKILSAEGDAPIAIRNSGRIEVAISCPRSESRLAKHMPAMFRLNNRVPDRYTQLRELQALIVDPFASNLVPHLHRRLADA